jgi:hypothetical protein
MPSVVRIASGQFKATRISNVWPTFGFKSVRKPDPITGADYAGVSLRKT